MDRCPSCGTKLFSNDIGDKVCPNCGIVKTANGKSEEENPGYIQ